VRLINRLGADTAITREAKARHHDDTPPLCLEGTSGADFTGVHPVPGETIVTKTLYSAFFNTGLDRMLHAEGVDTLVLAGLTTECCVASTAWDAFERDFHLFIATDACAAYEPGLHAGALEALKLSGAVLHPATEFAAVWK
jgi:ureidoacrylate peracid hydrolase